MLFRCYYEDEKLADFEGDKKSQCFLKRIQKVVGRPQRDSVMERHLPVFWLIHILDFQNGGKVGSIILYVFRETLSSHL